MSWDKNTVVLSDINAIVRVLKQTKTKYKLTSLGKVIGRGINDTHGPGEESYNIRRLEYKNIVVLDQMHQTADCDADDHLVSIEFKKKDEPKKWKLKIMVDESDD